MIARSMSLLAAFLAALLALGVMLSPGFPPGYISPLAWLVGTAIVWQGYRRYRLPGGRALVLGFALLLASALVGSLINLLFLMVAVLPVVPLELAFRLFSPVSGLPGLADTAYERIHYWYLVPVVGLPALAGAILVVSGLWTIRKEALRRLSSRG